MNELNRTAKQNKTEITNNKNQHNTTKVTSNLPLDPTLWENINITWEYGVKLNSKPNTIYITTNLQS